MSAYRPTLLHKSASAGLVLAGAVCALASCSPSPSASDPFEDKFEDKTLRIDVSYDDSLKLRVDTIVQWDGWHGRRVNLEKTLYPQELEVKLFDAATGDVLYADSKWLNPPDDACPGDPSYGVLFVPKPKDEARLEVTVYSAPDRGVDSKVAKELTSSVLASLNRESAPRVPYKTVRQGKDPKRCVNLALVAEGYTPDEMDGFYASCLKLDSALFAQPGFSGCEDMVNVVAVMLPSAESGISNPQTDKVVDSALKSHFFSFGLDRLVNIRDSRRMWDALEGIPAAYVMVLANTPTYGGSGYYNDYAIASAGHPQFTGIIIHEFGHSFAGLADEYEAAYDVTYTPDVEPIEPNITTQHDFSGKWQNLIDLGQASLIEGAGYQSKGVWRGCEHCLMRDIQDQDFCPVCAQAIERIVAYLTTPMEN